MKWKFSVIIFVMLIIIPVSRWAQASNQDTQYYDELRSYYMDPQPQTIIPKFQRYGSTHLYNTTGIRMVFLGFFAGTIERGDVELNDLYNAVMQGGSERDKVFLHNLLTSLNTKEANRLLKQWDEYDEHQEVREFEAYAKYALERPYEDAQFVSGIFYATGNTEYFTPIIKRLPDKFKKGRSTLGELNDIGKMARLVNRHPEFQAYLLKLKLSNSKLAPKVDRILDRVQRDIKAATPYTLRQDKKK